MADIQYRNEKGNAAKWGRVIAAMVCSLSFVVTAAGCGKMEEPIPVDLSSGTVEELQGEPPRGRARGNGTTGCRERQFGERHAGKRTGGQGKRQQGRTG